MKGHRSEQAASELKIVAGNIQALQPAYLAAMFEEMKIFRVVDTLVDRFQNGLLPIGVGNAGKRLFKYWKDTPMRISEADRRKFYERVFGFPSGSEGGQPNLNFNSLWISFLSSVASFVDSNNFSGVGQAGGNLEQVRKAARDLAKNLSLHGFGIAHFMATELQKVINEVIWILSDPEIRSVYGAQNMWQVVDQVVTLELGLATNTVRYRTMATSGTTIIGWLAKSARKLNGNSPGPILNQHTRHQSPRLGRGKPKANPTDSDLVNARNQWLSVNVIPP